MNAPRRLLLGCSLILCFLAMQSSASVSTSTSAFTFASAAASASSAVFTYRRIFKSSTPEFIEIKIEENSNKASYEIRQLDEDAGSSTFEISPTLRQKIFALIAQLNYFNSLDLDIHRKIANLGEKTFRWERGSEAHEVKFNYTVNTAASQLLQICEGLARQQELFDLLQRRIKYDRLGVNDALLELEADLSKGVLPEPQCFLPLLDQIASDYRFVDIARQRARALAEKIRHPGPAS
jgi:predicted RND superfamily exporter protein